MAVEGLSYVLIGMGSSSFCDVERPPVLNSLNIKTDVHMLVCYSKYRRYCSGQYGGNSNPYSRAIITTAHLLKL